MLNIEKPDTRQTSLMLTKVNGHKSLLSYILEFMETIRRNIFLGILFFVFELINRNWGGQRSHKANSCFGPVFSD